MSREAFLDTARKSRLEPRDPKQEELARAIWERRARKGKPFPPFPGPTYFEREAVYKAELKVWEAANPGWEEKACKHMDAEREAATLRVQAERAAREAAVNPGESLDPQNDRTRRFNFRLSRLSVRQRYPGGEDDR